MHTHTSILKLLKSWLNGLNSQMKIQISSDPLLDVQVEDSALLSQNGFVETLFFIKGLL